MSAARRYLPNYTFVDYALWEGDWERWDGVPVSMAPSSCGSHDAAVAELIFLIKSSNKRHECDAVGLPETDWIIHDRTVVRPDVCVV